MAGLRDHLRRAFESTGKTQEWLAEQIGYADQSTISGTLAGKKNPPIDKIDKWLEACGYRLELVPAEATDDDLEALVAGLPARHRLVLARLAAIYEDLPEGAAHSIEVLVRGYETAYSDLTARRHG